MKEPTANSTPNNFEASFSTLVISIASAASMALGITPNPNNGKTEKDLNMARFNIDILELLKEKTKNNLESSESQFLESVLNDLKLKFVQESK